MKKINAEKSTIASKPKSVETADSMTSNQIVAKLNSSIVKNNSSCAELTYFKDLSKTTNKRCSFFIFTINNIQISSTSKLLIVCVRKGLHLYTL
jgi:hypothetical protein